jgi:alpha-glucosidase
MAYYGHNGSGLQLPFNFQLLSAEWRADKLADLIRRYESLLPPGAWPNWVLGNHDRPRLATRIGIDQAPVAAMLLLTLRGTPTIYYGEELGMSNVPIPPELVQDPFEKQVPGHGLGRDPVRTPMPWDGTEHAGFTTGTPWLPLGADAATRNVDTQAHDPGSLLSLYRALLRLRRREPALSIGACTEITAHGRVLSYLRSHGARRLVVSLNLGATPVNMPVPEAGEVLLSTEPGRTGESVSEAYILNPNEGLVLALA